MRIPLSWLQQYLNVQETPEELAKRLTSLGIEVETIEQVCPHFSGVIVARVEQVLPHPQADKLHIAMVNDGSGQKQVVCGAANCREGLLVAFAPVGAKLGLKTDGTCELEIKKATLRGVESNGMLCSEDELGLAAERSKGIMELSSDYQVGEDFAKRCSDTVLDVALTPNLGHCLSMRGIAREIAASLGSLLRSPYTPEPLPPATDIWKIERVAEQECPSYLALVIEGAMSVETPLWVRLQLTHAGIRPVSFPVDCANFVMLSIGQPLHTFDAKAFPTHQITIENARGNEELHLIDGKTVAIPKGVLTITNGKTPCAIAGVMGGKESSVTSETKTLVVESAYFSSKAVRRAGKAVSTFSEAVRRFERGIDPNGFLEAAQLFWHLYHSQIPTATLQAVAISGRQAVPPKEFTCRRSRVQTILGIEISQHDVEEVFSKLGYPSNWVDGDTMAITVPPYRHDVTEEIDLIEDVAKLIGLESIRCKSHVSFFPSSLPDHPLYTCEHTFRRLLTSFGLQEFITCDLISPRLVALVENQPVASHAIIKVMNPVSAEQSILRPSLFPGLVDCLHRNIAHSEKSVAAFEIGSVHLRSEGKFTERLVAGILLSGKRAPHHFTDEESEFDFYDIKGLLEELEEKMGIGGLTIRPSSIGLFHDKRQAVVFLGGQQVGMLGEIHPRVRASLDIQQRIYFLELDIQDLFAQSTPLASMKPLAQYPCIERDWTVTVPESLSYQELLDTITRFRPVSVEAIQLISIFRHERIGAGKKNVSLRFIFRDPTRTLEQEEVDEAFVKLVHNVSQSIGVTV